MSVFQFWFPQGICLGVGLLGHMVVLRDSLVAQMVQTLLVMWETLVRSLGQDDPLEKEMATRSSSLAWEILWTGEPGGLYSMGLDNNNVAHISPQESV